MKPCAFAYAAPASVDAALQLLVDEEARALAGGQSLVPMLNFRLARPELLVDLNPLAELAGVRCSDGSLRIGAMTRQAVLEHSDDARRWPLLAQAEAHVGHAAIRNRGTVGGSVAHADPAAELPGPPRMDARFRLRRAGGERTVPAADIVPRGDDDGDRRRRAARRDRGPGAAGGGATAFVEYARTHGDFASRVRRSCSSPASTRRWRSWVPAAAPPWRRGCRAGAAGRGGGGRGGAAGHR